MRTDVLNFLKEYFHEETADHRDSMRETYRHVRPDVRELIRGSLAELIRTRSMSVDDVRQATSARARPDVRERIRSGRAELIRSRSMSTKDFWRAARVEYANEVDMYRQFFGDRRPAGEAPR